MKLAHNTKTKDVLTYKIQDQEFNRLLKKEEDFEKNATPEEKRKRKEKMLERLKEIEKKWKKEMEEKQKKENSQSQ